MILIIYVIPTLNPLFQINEIESDDWKFNFWPGPIPNQRAEEKKDDNFYNNFHDSNNFPEINQMSPPTLDASEINKPNQLFSLELPQLDVSTRAFIKVKQTDNISTSLDEPNILAAKVTRKQRKIDGKKHIRQY